MTKRRGYLFMTGNPGNGKSYIGNALGATNFVANFSFNGAGVTDSVHTAKVDLGDDEEVVLIDAPGLIETSFDATLRNAGLITSALNCASHCPLRLGVIVVDHNGRIQAADMMLIKKVHEAVHPKFRMFIIINQVKKRNLQSYLGGYREVLSAEVYKHTGAEVSIDDMIIVPDFDESERPDMAPLISLLKSIVPKTLQRATPILVTEEEYETIGEKILIYTVGALAVVTAPVWGIPYLVYKAVKKSRR